jgi:hypothetical protein
MKENSKNMKQEKIKFLFRFSIKNKEKRIRKKFQYYALLKCVKINSIHKLVKKDKKDRNIIEEKLKMKNYVNS